jgi:hypothetical protein
MSNNIEKLKRIFEQMAEATAEEGGTPTTDAPIVQSAPEPPVTTNPQSRSGKVVTVDKIVDSLNKIRSGKSFNDPLVNTALNNIFNSLSAAEKAVTDKVLDQMAQAIERITKQQSPPNPNNQEVKAPLVQPEIGTAAANALGGGPPAAFQGNQQAQAAAGESPMAGMMSGILAERKFNSLKDLVECLNKPYKDKIMVNGEEMEFGSPQHVSQIKIILGDLENMKNCYKRGSAIRLTLSGACTRLKQFLKDSQRALDEKGCS